MDWETQLLVFFEWQHERTIVVSEEKNSLMDNREWIERQAAYGFLRVSHLSSLH
jgi:Fe-S cluster biosynthesis and repair protein YggX